SIAVADHTPRQQPPTYLASLSPDSAGSAITPIIPSQPAPLQPPNPTSSVSSSSRRAGSGSNTAALSSTQASVQILGRRQRGESEDICDEESEANRLSTHTQPSNKRRRGDSTMRTDVDGQTPSNRPTSRMRSNGSARGEGSASHMKTEIDSMNNSQSETRWRPSNHFGGHSREEVTRILIQALHELDYKEAADIVRQRSGLEVETEEVSRFRQAVLNGEWHEAEALLWGGPKSKDGQRIGPAPLELAPGADRNEMRFRLREQKFLELLEKRDTTSALMVLRTELTPLCSEQQQTLLYLSSLLMCQDADDLRIKAEWDGANGQSRYILLCYLLKCVSPKAMLPEHRLGTLLDNMKRSQVGMCLYHTDTRPISLYREHTCDRKDFPTEIMWESESQPGEMWQLSFSHKGERLAACGSKGVSIWNTRSMDRLRIIDGHEKGEVGNLSWSPDDTILVTCGLDNFIKLWNPETGELLRELERFVEPVSCCVWPSDGQTFITGSFDKNKSICQWDLNGNRQFTWTKQHRTQDLALSADNRWLVAIDDQCHLHVYDFVRKIHEYEMELDARPTSISISDDSRYILVNKVNNEALLIEIETQDVVQKFTGQEGGLYTIRSAFGGANENFVSSGCERGNVLIWHKLTSMLVHKAYAHTPRCNAVAWNPADAQMFATCGDDKKVKV
ncbi:WD40-repeat-containing domain protein, partial [Podospora australis]